MLEDERRKRGDRRRQAGRAAAAGLGGRPGGRPGGGRRRRKRKRNQSAQNQEATSKFKQQLIRRQDVEEAAGRVPAAAAAVEPAEAMEEADEDHAEAAEKRSGRAIHLASAWQRTRPEPGHRTERKSRAEEQLLFQTRQRSAELPSQWPPGIIKRAQLPARAAVKTGPPAIDRN